jgi:hypothetical protein
VAKAQGQLIGDVRPERVATVLADDDDGIVATAGHGLVINVARRVLPLEGDDTD